MQQITLKNTFKIWVMYKNCLWYCLRQVCSQHKCSQHNGEYLELATLNVESWQGLDWGPLSLQSQALPSQLPCLLNKLSLFEMIVSLSQCRWQGIILLVQLSTNYKIGCWNNEKYIFHITNNQANNCLTTSSPSPLQTFPWLRSIQPIVNPQ